MSKEYDGLSRVIIENVGGRENINSLVHCVTRLRFKLKDESVANTDVLKATDGVLTVIQAGGLYQVVIGNHVPDVFESVCRLAGIASNAAETPADEAPKEKDNPFNAAISIISGVFTPILGIMCGMGIIKGLLSLLVFFNLMNGESSTYNVLYAISDGFFYYMPMLLAYTSAKKFGLPEVEALAITAGILYPTLLNGSELAHDSLFGIPVIMPAAGDYSASVIPIICSVAFAAWFERKIKKHIPDAVRLFALPMLVCGVSFCLTLWIIGPATSLLSEGLSKVFSALIGVSGILYGAVLGGAWFVLVMLGVHVAINPLVVVDYVANGSTQLLTPMFGSTFAMSGAILAVYFKTKDKKLKTMSLPAFISSVAGITEPAIYGIALPKKKPFVISCVVSGVIGALLMAFGVTMYTGAGMGVFGYTAYINVNTNDVSGMVTAIILSLISAVLAFILTFVTYKDDEPKTAAKRDGAPTVSDTPPLPRITLSASAKGAAMPMEQVPDPVFNTGVLGVCCGIEPEEGKIYAPVDGTISALTDTKHAIGIDGAGGVEVLIHVGVNTVEMKGEGFENLVKEGDAVKKGQLLMTVDLEKVKAAGYPATVIMAVSNTDDFASVEFTANGSVTPGDDLMIASR